MANITAEKLDDILEYCSKGEISVPNFQREVVWSPSQVARLAESILSGSPCGAIVTWQDPQVAFSEIKLEEPSKKKVKKILIKAKKHKPRIDSVVIDGLQRLTAISIAFGGLRNSNAKWRWGGKFFIDIKETEMKESVRLYKDSEISSKGLDKEEGWIKHGLFPLTKLDMSKKRNTYPLKGEFILHWNAVVGIIQRTNKKKWIKKATDIQIATSQNDIFAKIEIDNLNLGEITDLFETLNTAGTKVSAVDIVHANLVEHFQNSNPGFQLRDWIDDIHDDSKSRGWGPPNRRELMAQLVVSTDLALDQRFPAKPGTNTKKPSSVKNTDILNLHHKHWEAVIKKENDLKQAINDFQEVVLGCQFPQKDCPYPISSGIYVGLWWHKKFEKAKWNKNRLDKLFKAFFWRNVLSQRYDQGFLTQMASDMQKIKSFLADSTNTKMPKWKTDASNFLDKLFKDSQSSLPNAQEVSEMLTGAPPRGALGNGLKLPIKHRVKPDILDPSQQVIFPHVEDVQLHHIFPKKWITKNASPNNFGTWYSGAGTLSPQILDATKSLANLTPLTGDSNQKWSDSSPATMIAGLPSKSKNSKHPIWQERFISSLALNDLSSDKAKDFMERRAEEIADWILDQTKVN